jgi:hypothetical protein
MGVYVDSYLTITSGEKQFINNLFVTVLPKPKPGFLQDVKNKLFRKEPEIAMGLMEFLVPMPEQLEKTVTNGYSGTSPEWREWRLKHWGCPHDVALELCELANEHEIKMHFTSYGGDVINGLTNASKVHGFRFQMQYYNDHGAVGHCTENGDTSFEFPGEQPPADAGIPDELNKLFDLNERYEAYLEDR